MLLFRSEEHVRRWYARANRSLGATLSVPQQWELARRWYSGRADPDWRRFTVAEAEDVFAFVGLAGGFWHLQPR